MKTYRGYSIWQAENIWRAEMHGVTMCGRSLEQLKTVVDLHIADQGEYWRRINKIDAMED